MEFFNRDIRIYGRQIRRKGTVRYTVKEIEHKYGYKDDRSSGK